IDAVQLLDRFRRLRWWIPQKAGDAMADRVSRAVGCDKGPTFSMQRLACPGASVEISRRRGGRLGLGGHGVTPAESSMAKHRSDIWRYRSLGKRSKRMPSEASAATR